jgi:hypothetical protein
MRLLLDAVMGRQVMERKLSVFMSFANWRRLSKELLGWASVEE